MKTITYIVSICLLFLLVPLYAEVPEGWDRPWKPIQWEPIFDYKSPPLNRTITLTIDLPIRQEDGTIINPDDIKFQTAFCYHIGEFRTRVESVIDRHLMSIMEVDRVGHVWTNIVSDEGTFFCRSRVTSIEGVPSEWTETLTFRNGVRVSAPKPPTDLWIN